MSLASRSTTIEAIKAIVSDKAVITNHADLVPYINDYRGIYRGDAQLVALPGTTEEVSRVVAWCHAHGVPIVPQGGNTSLMGGAVPEAGDMAVVINLKRMNHVLAVDPLNDTMTVQAGVTLTAARTAAEEAGRLFPLRIGSEGTCQIGGNLSTNAGGTAVLRYGNMRELTLGIEAVLPDGRIYSSLKGLRKDNTGYDLKQLFLGSEGTLGIITGAVLKVYPQQSAAATAFVAVSSPTAAVSLLGLTKRTAGPVVTTFELISRPALELVLCYLGDVTSPLREAHAWMVLVELTSAGDAQQLEDSLVQILERGMEEGLVLDAAVAGSVSDAHMFWRIREEISDAQTREGGSVRCDVSVPLSSIAGFIESATAQVLSLEPAARMVIYGHMGDGNVHFNPLRPAGQAASDFLAVHGSAIGETVDTLAAEMDGSISAEHGVGVSKREALRTFKSPVELELMQQIKKALDPQNLMNPRKVLPQDAVSSST